MERSTCRAFTQRSSPRRWSLTRSWIARRAGISCSTHSSEVEPLSLLQRELAGFAMGSNSTRDMSTPSYADGKSSRTLRPNTNSVDRPLPSVRRRPAMPDDRDKTYDVGFGKPPSHGQFRKGVSGNPRGRPKGKRNLATVLERTLEEKVVINENGERKTVTKLEAALKQMVNKAAGGDLRSE